MFNLTLLKRHFITLLDRLLVQSLSAPSRLKGFWLRIGLAFVVAGQKFNRDRGFGQASGLAYSTLLALVPVTALVLMIATSFFISVDDLQRLAGRHLIPSSGSAVSQYIEEFAKRARAISVISSIMLVVTSVSLLQTVESAINDIWHVQERRPLWVKLTAFWSLLTLGPVLVVGSIYFTAKLRQVPFLTELLGIGIISHAVSYSLSLICDWAAFFLLYTRLPSTRVETRAGLVGGVVAGTLWEVAKTGFDWYVTSVVSFSQVYGSLGAVPLFLLWLYLTWIILLWGAELSYAWQHLPVMKTMRSDGTLTGWDRVGTAIRMLVLIARRFVRGEGMVSAAMLASGVRVDIGQVQAIAAGLEDAGLIHRVVDQDTGYLLAQPPETIGLDEVVALFDGLPSSAALDFPDEMGGCSVRVLDRVRHAVRGSLAGMTVRTLLDELEYQVDQDQKIEIVL